MVAALAACVLVMGCTGDPDQASATVSDGTGLRIIESRQPAWDEGRGWSVGKSVLDLTSTGEGPENEFYRVTDATRLSDGRFVVANDGTSEVRFFTSSGQFEVSAGRSGDGPGEFRRITTLSRMRGDSVAVYDVLLNRLTILGPDGSLGRVLSLGSLFRRARHLRAYDDSTFLGLASSFDGTTQLGRYRTTYAVVRLDSEARGADTVGLLKGREGFRTSTVDGPLPFPKEGHLSTLGREIVIGDADSLAFDRFSELDLRTQAVSVAGYPLALTQDQVDSTRNALLRRADGRAHPPDILEALESLPIPSHTPGYSRLLLDEEGYVWAARYYRGMRSDLTVDWEVFAPSGEWLGMVATPPGFTVHRIGRDEILGVQRDELDVEHVQVLKLVRSL